MLRRRRRALPSVACTSAHHRRAVMLPALVLIAVAVWQNPALAWSPPPTHEHRGLPTINGQPGTSEVLSYFADDAWGDIYSPKGHGYVIQRAIAMLRADGYENWADVAQANQMHLLSGAAHADNYLGRIRAYFQLELFWGLASVDLYEYDITCRGGCDHYHNVSDGTGLKMPVEATLASIFDWLVVRFLLSFGPASVDLDIVPDLWPQYPSAVKLCQQRFNLAQHTWRTGAFTYPSRSAIESSFYELGWACHLLADQAVVQHQYNEFFGGHADYENFADGKGNPQQYPQYHPTSAVPFGAYHHDSNTPGGPWTAYDYARTVAEKIHNEPGHHALAEDGGPAERDQALRFAIPLAEAYTAGLIARFMSETGVPAKVPPVSGYVRADNGAPIPGAYVFYADAGSMVKIEQNVPDQKPVDRWKSWDMVRADNTGRYSLPVQPRNYYLLRAASPNHSFEGKTSANLEFGERKCPVVYYQEKGMFSGNTLDLFLKPLSTSNVTVLSQGLRVRRPPLRAATTAAQLMRPETQFAIKPGTHLSVSGTEVSHALSRSLERAVLKVEVKDCVLGVAGGGTKLPETSYVDVQLSRLVEMTTGAVVSTPDQATRALDRNRTDRAEVARMKNDGPPRTMPIGMQALSANQVKQLKSILPTRQITDSRGRPKTVYRLEAPEDITSIENRLDPSGLLVVPGTPGAEVEVSVVPGAGLLGSGVAPVRLITNQIGRARLGIQAGSHAGLLRLRFRITRAPDGLLVGAEQIVNLLIQPRVVGPDPTTSRPPALGVLPTELHMIQGTVIPTEPSRRVAPRSARTAQPAQTQPTVTAPRPRLDTRPVRRTAPPAPRMEPW